jgi:hypothetical protein
MAAAAAEFNRTGELQAKRARDRVACFVHLRDLVRHHPQAAPASAILAVRAFEENVIALKTAHEMRVARERALARVRKEAFALREARAHLLALIRKRADLEPKRRRKAKRALG